MVNSVIKIDGYGIATATYVAAVGTFKPFTVNKCLANNNCLIPVKPSDRL